MCSSLFGSYAGGHSILKEFKKPIAHARCITIFIYRHGRILSLMRDKVGADLVRPGATQFATSFLTLKSLHKYREALKGLFLSEEWNENKLAKLLLGQKCMSLCYSWSFGRKLKTTLLLQSPPYCA
jgi:hypothetical protein